MVNKINLGGVFMSALKAKTKSKPKAKTKAKLKLKLKPKSKAKTKTKLKAKLKTKPKAKLKTKAKPKTKLKQKPTSKLIKAMLSTTPKIQFNRAQKTKLLPIIEKIVNLRKGERDGLGTYEPIDRILDKYNQHFIDVTEKFDAIIEYGMKKDPAFIPDSVFVITSHHNKNEIELYALLEKIWEGRIQYASAVEKMNSIFAASLVEKTTRHLQQKVRY